MPTEPLTTIKVPKPLRERITRGAAAKGLSSAGLISELLDEHERRVRFRAVRRAYAIEDPTYVDEIDEWDTLAGDGLDS